MKKRVVSTGVIGLFFMATMFNVNIAHLCSEGDINLKKVQLISAAIAECEGQDGVCRNYVEEGETCEYTSEPNNKC